MKPLTSSIRRHLLCWLLAPIAFICAVSGLVTYLIAVSFATEAYDGALLDSAHSVSERLRIHASELTVDLPPAALAILKHGDKDVFFYQVLAPDGSMISGDTYVPDPPAGIEVKEEPEFYNGTISSREVRILAVKIPTSDAKTPYVVIRAAETTNGRTELIQSILLGVVLPQLILIVLAALAVWFGVARGLRPLAVLKEAVESRNPSDLRLLDLLNVPKEVKPLVMAINNLLNQLQEESEAQRRFVSNAAHQLRTPLAGLKTQTEIALRQEDHGELRHSLRQINTSANRAARLAQQLLTLARLEPTVFANVRKEAVDLNKIARESTSELVRLALDKEIDLGFEGTRSPQIIKGDSTSLHELSLNLIENAILYTQRGGKVTVRVSSGAAGPTLSVEDNGPGIPFEEREQVFERFYRVLRNCAHGTGLGLSIVREIVEAHNATIRLEEGPDGSGARFEVEFRELDFSPVTHALEALRV